MEISVTLILTCKMREDLKKLGLSFNEIKVYLSLLKVGETSVGGIIDDLKVHRQIVYNALNELEARGMVEKTVINKINNYKVSDPKILIENVNKQELIAKRLSKNIAKEMKKTRHEHEINVYDGEAKLRKYYLLKYKSMPPDSQLRAIAATGIKFEQTIGIKNLKKFDKIRLKKNIINRHVSFKQYRKDINKSKEKLHQESRKVRYLPFESTNPITTIIWHDSVAYQSFFGESPFIIEIRNKQFRDSFKDHFEMLWKMAKR